MTLRYAFARFRYQKFATKQSLYQGIYGLTPPQICFPVKSPPFPSHFQSLPKSFSHMNWQEWFRDPTLKVLFSSQEKNPMRSLIRAWLTLPIQLTVFMQNSLSCHSTILSCLHLLYSSGEVTSVNPNKAWILFQITSTNKIWSVSSPCHRAWWIEKETQLEVSGKENCVVR